MRRLSFTLCLTLSAFMMFGLMSETGQAQDLVQPKLDASVCRQVQKQVDDLVAISESASMSREEKIAALSQSWAQSIATMRNDAKKDEETAQMVKGLSDSVAKILALGLASSQQGQKDVSSDTKQALNDVNEQIKPYMSFMKILCPKLVLPPVMQK
jgi:hypothetical protein